MTVSFVFLKVLFQYYHDLQQKLFLLPFHTLQIFSLRIIKQENQLGANTLESPMAI